MADDELWHVRMSHDEVKQLSLEQLDDLFRLELIEADTLVWQPGMTEWLPLSVVAGLENDDPEPVNIAVSEPPRMVPTQSAWPPRGAAPVSTRPLPPLSAPPPPSARSAAPARPAQSAWPPAATSRPPAAVPAALSNPSVRPATISPYASTLQEPPRAVSQPPHAMSMPPSPYAAPPQRPVSQSPYSAPPSIAPVAIARNPLLMTQPSIRYRQRAGGGWMIALALVAGTAVTLYRNDVVHAAALSVGQEPAYLKLETALGGPSFGTPRAVQEMAAATAALSATLPAAAPTSAPVAPSTSDASPPSVNTAATTTATSEEHAPATDAPQKSESAPVAKSEPAPAPKREAASKPVVAAKPPAPHVASRPAPAAHEKSSDDNMFATPKKAKKSKGSEYDPLNGSL